MLSELLILPLIHAVATPLVMSAPTLSQPARIELALTDDEGNEIIFAGSDPTDNNPDTAPAPAD